jgi:hypothetical protein
MHFGKRVQTFFGWLLLVLGLLGPLTFADDLRHLGEIAVAIGFALSGFLLLAPQSLKHWRCGRSVPLASPFVLLGVAAGVFMDKTVPGVFLGACAGSTAVWWHCSRYRRAAI